MFHFDWTINLVSLVTTIAVVAGGVWKFVYNHLSHLETKINAQAEAVKKDLNEHRETIKKDLYTYQVFLNDRLSGMQADIREIREHLFR